MDVYCLELHLRARSAAVEGESNQAQRAVGDLVSCNREWYRGESTVSQKCIQHAHQIRGGVHQGAIQIEEHALDAHGIAPRRVCAK